MVSHTNSEKHFQLKHFWNSFRPRLFVERSLTIKSFAYIILLDLFCLCMHAACIKCKRNDRTKEKKMCRMNLCWEEKKPVSIEQNLCAFFVATLLLAYAQIYIYRYRITYTYMFYTFDTWNEARAKCKKKSSKIIWRMKRGRKKMPMQSCRSTLDIASFWYLRQWSHHFDTFANERKLDLDCIEGIGDNGEWNETYRDREREAENPTIVQIAHYN